MTKSRYNDYSEEYKREDKREDKRYNEKKRSECSPKKCVVKCVDSRNPKICGNCDKTQQLLLDFVRIASYSNAILVAGQTGSTAIATILAPIETDMLALLNELFDNCKEMKGVTGTFSSKLKEFFDKYFMDLTKYLQDILSLESTPDILEADQIQLALDITNIGNLLDKQSCQYVFIDLFQTYNTALFTYLALQPTLEVLTATPNGTIVNIDTVLKASKKLADTIFKYDCKPCGNSCKHKSH